MAIRLLVGNGGGWRKAAAAKSERDSIAVAALQLTRLVPIVVVQSLTMVRPANVSLIVALCCLGLVVAQRNIRQGFGTASANQQGADYRRLHLTPYHGHGYHGLNRVYHGHGTNRVNLNGYRK